MSALVFLSIAVALSLLGSAILLFRYRKPPPSEWGIDEFRREMQALAPNEEEPRRAPPAANPQREW
jgi:hypothetical protein